MRDGRDYVGVVLRCDMFLLAMFRDRGVLVSGEMAGPRPHVVAVKRPLYVAKRVVNIVNV